MAIDKIIIILYTWKYSHSVLNKSMHKQNYLKLAEQAIFFFAGKFN